MSVASNTGPLIALAKVDLLSLLPVLFGTVHVPPGVQRELLAKVGPEAQRLDGALATSVQITPAPAPSADVDQATHGLGEGERDRPSRWLVI